MIRATARPAGTSRARPRHCLIAGLIPDVRGPVAAEMRQALDERARLIQQRAATLADAALRDREPWIRALGTPPTDLRHAVRWHSHAQTIAAYRDRYAISGTRPLGDAPGSDAQRLDALHAATALAMAQQLATAAQPVWSTAPGLGIDPLGISR